MSSSIASVSFLTDWLCEQRWYAGKGSTPVVTAIGSWELPGRDQVRATTYLVRDTSSSPPTLYQIPTTERFAPHPEIGHALIAVLDPDSELPRYVYDAPHDPAFAEPLLQVIVNGRHADGVGMTVTGIPLDVTPLEIEESHVLRGEQSNTSIIYRVRGARDSDSHAVVCKLFRAVHDGVNPDVELQSALSAAGSVRVPASIGSIVGEWTAPDGAAPERTATERGHLAFAQEFVENSEDAWRVALGYAESGRDFTRIAFEMGEATADIHATLAATLPTDVVTDEYVASVLRSWRSRFMSASAEAPVVAEFYEALDSLYRAAGTISWPRLQRIHGDLHLGQVLIDADGHCVIIDFEGEPLRPMHERSRPDLALRDIAGMLRSFDYVSGTHPEVPGIAQWTHDCRHAFLDGYIQRSGDDLRAHRVLLDAFEADKAVYEALYEARNRPGWLPIPTAAVQRLARRALEYSLDSL